MAYPHASNRLAFFEPIMVVAANDTKPLCGVDIGASNATHGEFVCVRPCIIREAKFSVTLENVVATTTAPYITLSKYTAPAAGGTSTSIGVITVPTGTNIGSVVYKTDLSTSFAIGDVVQIKHVVGVGAPTGQGNVDWTCEADPETKANNTDLTATA